MRGNSTTDTRSIAEVFGPLLFAVGLVALVIGVGMTAVLVGFMDWNPWAVEAGLAHERGPAIIPFIMEAVGSLLATSAPTLWALVTGVVALVLSGVARFFAAYSLRANDVPVEQESEERSYVLAWDENLRASLAVAA